MNDEQRGFGWSPSLPDQRDVSFIPSLQAVSLPATVDLTPDLPGVYDQGTLGSCTAHSVASAYMTRLKKDGHSNDGINDIGDPSRLFIYYNIRLLRGSVRSDSGASIRDSMKAIAKYGTTDETKWPYLIDKFRRRAPKSLYEAAQTETGRISYQAVDRSAIGVKQALADGYPVCIGFSVYSSFMYTTVRITGEVQYPQTNESVLGGHAVLITGYDDTTQRFKFRNSWGKNWGNEGNGTMPYNFLSNPYLAGDFWVLKTI